MTVRQVIETFWRDSLREKVNPWFWETIYQTKALPWEEGFVKWEWEEEYEGQSPRA